MKQQLRILHLEDDSADAELVQATLDGAGIDSEIIVVATAEHFIAELERADIDLVLADLNLPTFDGMSALAIVRERNPDLPFVFVSGKLGEEAAIDSLKSGASDYVLKSSLSRLPPAVHRALSQAEDRAQRKKAEEELATAYLEIRDRAERYQNLFNSIRDVIVVADHHRRILHINQPALRETFGYEQEEVLRKGVRILYADEEGYRLTGREIFDYRKPVKGKILELTFKRKNGEEFIGEIYALKQLDSRGNPTGNIGIIRDISERKKAEEALRESEMRSYQLQLELVYAAEVQAKLLPRTHPLVADFDIAARCVPAKQVGGDFFDWQEVFPGIWTLTLGDVMGKGMAAAMLMATVRAAIRAVARNHRPAAALELAEQALLSDLDSSESFVTLFHAQLDTAERRLSFVDCGHGYAFMRRRSGEVEDLLPRGLPVGVPGSKNYMEGEITFAAGDILVLYSDGLPDARPELALNNLILGEYVAGGASAADMVERLIGLTEQPGPLPDDVTVLVVRYTG